MSTLYEVSPPSNEENEAARTFRSQLEDAVSWLPLEFVDLCEQTESTPTGEDWLRHVQRMEMEVLFGWCRAWS